MWAAACCAAVLSGVQRPDKWVYKPQHPMGNGTLGNELGEISRPVAVCTLPNGDVVVADEFYHRLMVFTMHGLARYVIGGFGERPGEFHGPAALATDGLVLYVVERNNHRLQKLSLPYGKPIGMTGSYGSGRGELAFPAGLALLNGLLYVSDSHNHRVVAYDVHLSYRFSFGTRGRQREQLSFPEGIAAYHSFVPSTAETAGANASVASRNAIVVADSGNDRLQIFDTRGRWLRVVGASGTAAGRFDYPSGIAIYTRGEPRLYVTEFSGRRMQVFSVEGDFVEALEFPWMGRMAGVHADQRRIFAADWDLHLVQVILRVTPHGSAAYSSGKQLLRTSTAVQSVDKLSAVSSSQPGAKKQRGQTEKGHAQAVRDIAGNSGGGGGGSTHADAHVSVAEGGAAHRQSAGAAPAAVSALMERPSDSPRSSRAAAKPSKHKKAGSKGHTHAAEHTTERTARRRR